MTRVDAAPRAAMLRAVCRGLLLLLTGVAPVWAQPPASFTSAQAQAGETTYQHVCASCHKANLAGAFEAPELAGRNFLSMWGGRPASDLLDYIKAAMPPAGRKPGDDALTNIVAYILRRNGMHAGGTALHATSEGTIAAAPPIPAGRPEASPRGR